MAEYEGNLFMLVDSYPIVQGNVTRTLWSEDAYVR